MFKEYKGKYGYRKVYGVLINQYNIPVSQKVVRRIMRELGLRCKLRKWQTGSKKKKVAAAGFIYENLLKRDFSTNAINEKWVTDVTEISFKNRKFFVSAVLDLFNNEIIGHSISEIHDVELVERSYKLSLKQRKIKKNKNNQLILHTDQGFAYRSTKWNQLTSNHFIKQSMSRKANPFDNACIESFFSYLKTESRDELEQAKNIEEAKKVILKFIRYYNHRRIQEALNYLTPKQYATAC